MEVRLAGRSGGSGRLGGLGRGGVGGLAWELIRLATMEAARPEAGAQFGQRLGAGGAAAIPLIDRQRDGQQGDDPVMSGQRDQ